MAAEPLADTEVRAPIGPVGPVGPVTAAGEAAPPSRRVLLLAGGGLATLAAVVTTALLVFGGGTPAAPHPTATPLPTPQDLGEPSPLPTVSGTAAPANGGQVRFSWTIRPPDPRVEAYFVTRTDTGGGSHPQNDRVTSPTYTLAHVAGGGRACIQVKTADTTGATGRPVEICAG